MSKVTFVGGGPGNPDLLTWRGRQALETAACVVHDPDAPASLLGAAGGAQLVPAGPAVAVTVQTLLVRAAGGGEVVRLVSGDTASSPTAMEEAERLADAGVALEILPGIAESSAAAAYAGIRFEPGTSVVARSIEELAGLPPDCPAVAAGAIATPRQRVLWGTAATLPELVGRSGLPKEAVIIAGESVSRLANLNWFERLPLFGLSVVVTRGQGQAGELAARLRAAGAEAVEIPAIEILPPADQRPLDDALSALDTYDWLIFTSVNGVRFFLERLDRSPLDLRRLRARIAAIGPATRRAVEQLHLKVDLMPDEYVAESLVKAFTGHELSGKRVLLPRAAVARDLAPAELRRMGARVDVVEAYRSAAPQNLPSRAREVLERRPDWITFTSSSTVANMVAAAGREAFRDVRVASIGPVTTATARSLGLEVHVEAAQFTVDGLVAALKSAR